MWKAHHFHWSSKCLQVFSPDGFSTISGVVVSEARASRAYAQVRVAVEHMATSPRIPSSSIRFSFNLHMNFFTPEDPFAHVIRMFSWVDGSIADST